VLLHGGPLACCEVVNGVDDFGYVRPPSACSVNETDGLSGSGDLDASEIVDMIRYFPFGWLLFMGPKMLDLIHGAVLSV
jgi:hypothetical protein